MYPLSVARPAHKSCFKKRSLIIVSHNATQMQFWIYIVVPLRRWVNNFDAALPTLPVIQPPLTPQPY